MISDTIKWTKSHEGFTESKCGRFRITPEYWGRCNPQSYKLSITASKSATYSFDTQTQAKEYAQELTTPKPKKEINIQLDLNNLL